MRWSCLQFNILFLPELILEHEKNLWYQVLNMMWYVVRNQGETAVDTQSTSEHQRIQQYAIFRFNSWRRNYMYTTNCQVCDTCYELKQTAEDAKSTSEHRRIQQCANFHLIFEHEKSVWYEEVNHMMFMIDLTWCDMYTTNCEICGTKSSRNRRRWRKHERTSTYTAVRHLPV